MTRAAPFAFLFAVLLAGVHGPALASPGDVFVPAHRTRDGSFVPPNVAPMSGGSYLAQRPSRGRLDAGWHRSDAPRVVRIKVAGNRAPR